MMMIVMVIIMMIIIMMSFRPDKRFRLALGSFVEEYNNKVQVSFL